MININQLTTQLRMLPDQVLQRVAMMYKQDPYILPLVVSEGMARKKLRAASQAQMAQPQPKVTDQAVASLGYTPEESGIAQLQAQNMQGLADGGIAGYADGGDMDFADRSEPVVRMAEGGVARYDKGGKTQSIYDLDRDPLIQKLRGIIPDDELARMDRAAMLETIEKLAAAGKDVLTYPGRAAASVAESVISRPLRALGVPVPKIPASFYGGDRSSATPYMDALTRDKNAPRPAPAGLQEPPLINPETGKPYTMTAAPAATGLREPGAPAPASAAPVSAPASAPSATSGTAPTRPSAPSEGGIYSLAGRLFDPLEAATQRRLDYARIAGRLRGEEERAEFEAGKPKEKAFAGLEGLLKREEEGAAAEKENAKALAIFNAGLAMMAGGSPRALENIAKGAMVGTGQYADAMKDFKKAARERMKMQADIEQARRAEARDDNKTALTLMQRANDREDRIENLTIEAGTKLGLDKASVIGRLYGTQMETESRERTARASDPLALFRALSVPGPIREGYEFAQRAKAEPVDERTYRKEWASSPVLQMNYPNVDDYVKMMMPRPQGGTPGAASQSADEALVRKYLNPPR